MAAKRSRRIAAGPSLARAAAPGRRARSVALRALYERTSAKLYGICLRVLGSESEAQDALQEVYVTVWQQGRRSSIAARASADHLAVGARAQQGHRPAARAPRAGRGLDAADRHCRRPASRRSRSSSRRRMRARLAALPRRARRARADDDPHAPSSKARPIPSLRASENVPLPTMKSWIRRGLLRLRGCLEQ